jgi:hypothetical protein
LENRVSSLLILKQKESSLKGAEVFLGNRGWLLNTAFQLKQMILVLAQKNPEYVLIPVDFPHAKILMLPQLLAQAFPAKIILYAENPSTTAMMRLQEIKMPYKIYPPVSGPAIERMIFKIQKDQEEAQARGREGRGVTGSHGEGENVDVEFRFREQQMQQARGALTALLGGDGSSAAPANTVVLSSESTGGSEGAFITGDSNASGTISDGTSNSEHMLRPGDLGSYPEDGSLGDQRGFGEGSMYIPQNEGSGNIYGIGDENSEGRSDSAAVNYLHLGGSEVPNAKGQYQTPRNRNPLAQNDGDLGGQEAEGIPFYGRKDLDFSKVDDDSLKEALSKARQVREDGEGFHFKSSGRVNLNSKKDEEPVFRFRSVEKITEETIIVKGTEKALQESVSVRSQATEKLKTIDKTKKAVCITVESPKFSGYLVAVMGDEKALDAQFVDLIRERLFAFLKAHGEPIEDRDRSMEIKLQEVEFEAWALEQADFLKRAVHDHTEVAMAFFPSQDTTVRLEASASERMLQLDMSELRGNVVLEFDLYIYLPQNQKYLLYTPEGRPLYEEQKKRLMDKGVAKMHLRKESAQGVKRYRAQNFLNDKIEEFKKKKQKVS